MSDCIFCKIIAGELPSSKVYEDDKVVAFMDILPINPGHALVIPKTHFEFLADMDSSFAESMWEAARKVAAALRKADIKCEAINLHLADGAIAGQEVPHVHLHVVPRFSGDKAGYRFPPDRQKPDDETWKRIVNSILEYM